MLINLIEGIMESVDKGLHKLTEQPLKKKSITPDQINYLYNDTHFVEAMENQLGKDWKDLVSIGVSYKKCCGENAFAVKEYEKQITPKGIVKMIPYPGYIMYCAHCGRNGNDSARSDERLAEQVP